MNRRYTFNVVAMEILLLWVVEVDVWWRDATLMSR